MKNWWLNLSVREKQILSLGACIVTLFIIYELTFAPLSHKVQSLRQKIQTNKQLLTWMQESDKQIRSLEKNQKNNIDTSQSLLSLTQAEINNTPFAKSVSQLQQAENDAIQLHLQQISFDNFAKWLIRLCQKNNLIITEATITPGNMTGIVDVSLKLQKDQ